MQYRSREGSESERRVDPYRLATTGRRWYLVARDVDRDVWRTFRLDRVQDARRTGHRFEASPPPDGTDLDTMLNESITTTPYRFSAKVIVNLPARGLRALIPPAVGVVGELPGDGQRSVLTVGSDSIDALAGHLVALGAPFDVVEPPELRDRMDELADDLDRVRRQRESRSPPPPVGS